eukprot:3487963-Pyramimonas_sp.AAC.2
MAPCCSSQPPNALRSAAGPCNSGGPRPCVLAFPIHLLLVLLVGCLERRDLLVVAWAVHREARPELRRPDRRLKLAQQLGVGVCLVVLLGPALLRFLAVGLGVVCAALEGAGHGPIRHPEPLVPPAPPFCRESLMSWNLGL